MAAKWIAEFGLRIAEWRTALIGIALLGICVSVVWADSYSERAATIESLSTEKKAELLRKKQRFDELKDAEKQRMRDLDAQLSAEPNATELKNLMGRYCNWLKNLSSAERAAVLSLPADKRIERIKQIVQRQENSRFQEYVEHFLPSEDRDAVRKWLEAFVMRREDDIVKHLRGDHRRQVKDADDRQVRSKLLMVALFWRPPGSDMPYPKKEEVEKLVASLSEQTRKELEKVQPSEDRTKGGYQIVRAALGSVALPPPSQEDLQKFLASLPADQKERLEAMDSDETRRELTRMYRFAQFRQGSGGGSRGDGRRDGDRDGPRGPRPGGPPPPGFASPK